MSNARIVSERNDQSEIGGETFLSGRKPGELHAFVSTESNGLTTIAITRNGFSLVLDGNEARTLYRLLKSHYTKTN